MKKFMRIPYEQDSSFSYEELRANISSMNTAARIVVLYSLNITNAMRSSTGITPVMT